MQYVSLIIESAGMNLPSDVCDSDGWKYASPSFGPSAYQRCGDWLWSVTIPPTNAATPIAHHFATPHLIRGPALRCATYAQTAANGITMCSQ